MASLGTAFLLAGWLAFGDSAGDKLSQVNLRGLTFALGEGDKSPK